MTVTRLCLAALQAVLLIIPVLEAESADVFVTVEQGVLRGTTATSVYNTTYTAFKGIPFAEPPVGELRFKAPVPASRWEGVRDATAYGPDCVQFSGSSRGGGSEDCLYMNVFVPGVPRPLVRLPVIFWVYGGAFTDGSGSDEEQGPDFLVSSGVILVTSNYRLGPLGFLSTGDAVVPGNAALKDQLLALTWVHRNIARFGGDPRRVTLQGQSAGGVAVSLHFVSPRSRGLFSRLIVESGNLISRPTLPSDTAREHAFRLGAALGFQTEDSQQLVNFLRSVQATDLLVNQSLVLTPQEQKEIITIPWGPVIEPQLEGAFISESPIRALIEGRFHKVPVLTGTNSGEHGPQILDDQELVKRLNEDFESVVGPFLHLSTVQKQSLAASKLKEFYFGNETISTNNPVPLVNFYNDIDMFAATDEFIRTVDKLSKRPIYQYEFDYRGVNVQTTPFGVNHSGELPFLFIRKDTNYDLSRGSEEDRVRRNVLRLWTNFARYGNPTPKADPVVWKPYHGTERSYLLMRAEFSLAHNRLGERMDFWNENVPLEPFPDT